MEKRLSQKIAVIGSGLSGLLVAHYLLLENPKLEITILSDHNPYAGSLNPLAILQPFPGASFRIAEEQILSFKESVAFLKTQCSSLYQEDKMYRPIVGSKTGQRLDKTFALSADVFKQLEIEAKKVDYAVFLKTVAEFLNPAEKQSTLLSSESDDKTLQQLPEKVIEYSGCYAVLLAELLAKLKKTLLSRKVRFVDGTLAHIERGDDTLIVSYFGDSEPVNLMRVFDTAILAMGSGLSDFFPKLPLYIDGGQTIFQRQSLTENHLLSIGSHYVKHPNQELLSYGATHFDWNKKHPNEADTVETLNQAFVKYLKYPPIIKGNVRGSFKGQRTSFSNDKKALFGQIPMAKDLKCPIYVCGAFGGTALLWAPYAAKMLSKTLLCGELHTDSMLNVCRVPHKFFESEKISSALKPEQPSALQS